MTTHTSIDYISDSKTVIALGCFDGVHAGHRKVISTAVEIAKELSVSSAVWTFDRSPKNYFSPHSVPTITDFEEKRVLVEALSVDKFICVPFGPDIFEITPVDFFEKILLGRLSARHLVCGFNYTFGKKSQGDIKLLSELCCKAGIGLTVIDAVSIDGIQISSSAIRNALAEGNVELAAKMLGRPYILDSEVFSNQHLASKLGFPTANQMFKHNKLVPKKGVYVTRILIDGEAKYGITNVGIRPTVSDNTLCAETHIFDFSDNLYDKKLHIEFLSFLREEQRFGSVEALSRQVHEDIEKAKDYIQKKDFKADFS